MLLQLVMVKYTCNKYLEMARKILLVERVVVYFDFAKCSEIIWHEHDWN